MNFFADECVYKLTVDLLRSWGHDVLTAQEAGLAGKPDQEILAYAVVHERVLIANKVHNVLEHLLKNTTIDKLSKSPVIIDQNKYRIR